MAADGDARAMSARRGCCSTPKTAASLAVREFKVFAVKDACNMLL
jgi:hypothetical protein